MSRMTPNQKLIERVRKHYVDKLGRENGALSQFARDIKVDPRYPSWWKQNDRPIPATYALAVEEATEGHVTAVDVMANEIRHRKDRLEARRRKMGIK